MSSERCTRRKCDTGQSKQPKRRHRRQPSSTMSTMKTTAINGFTSALVLLAMVSSCFSAELNSDFVSMDVDMMASASSLVADGVVTGAINGHFVVSRAPDDGRLRSFVDDDMSFARSAEKRELRAFFGNVSAADFEGLVAETSRKVLEQKGDAFLTAGFSDEVRNATLWGLVTEEVSRQLLSRSNVRDVDSSAVQETLARLTLGQSCPLLGGRQAVCDQNDYRSFDGTCNNLEHPLWGAINTPFHRILPARFGDGLASEPKAKSGEKLPSPWQIANNVHAVQPATVNRYVSAITPFWGQLVVNDILKTDRFRATPNDESCVSEEASPKTASSPSSESWPIRGNSNGVFCIDYRRSLTSPKHQCKLGAREQLNLASSFLDGSLIYGNTESDAGFLRSFSSGLMKLDAEGLPLRGPVDSCQEIGGCFLVGDARANENAGQAALATLLLREHNRIAETLQTFNPHWDDEKTFQETRRIVIAEIQHITFNEFLQTVLDEVHYFKNDLGINHSGYSIGYSTTLNPGVGNAVGSSVIGFLSTMFPLNISVVNHTTEALLSIPADSGLYNPGLLKTADDVDSVVAGLVVSQASNVGPTFGSHEASKYMAAYSIQQGRDHGLQGYTSYRKWCGFPVVTKFGDLAPILGEKALATLQSTFETVDDIDLLTGGLLEKPTEGSLVGPTFSCIMAQQFRRLREADRFWYESDIPPAKFSKGQLNEIRKVSLAGLICANTRISQVQPQVFLSTDPFLNAPVLCASLESMSLDSWRELEPPEIVVPDNLLDESIAEAGKDVMVRYHREVELVEKNLIAQPGSASAKAYAFHVPSEAACKQGNYSLMLELATKKLAHLLDEESTVEARRVKRQIVPQGNFLPSAAPQFNQIFVGDRVPRPPRTCPDAEDNRPCDPKSPFRTYSGWCNNLEKPQYGKDLTPFNRLLAPKYEDGISRPRSLSVTGRPLPSPRLISSFIHADISRPHSRYTLIVMQFGQFLDHDITLTPVHSGFNGAALECKECDSAIRVHPECFPIPMPPNDPYYPHVNEQTGRPFCIPLVRSLPGQTKLGPREQLNQNTAFLDGSQVYGQNICDARILRNFVGGQLNATSHPQRGKPLLPQTTKFHECEAPSKVCFIGGDNRPSEQPGLAAIHTIFMREHNRIARDLAFVNPHWSDEQLFQNSRKIMTATLQHMSYNEFLPRVLGWNAVKLYELDLLPEGYYNGYDSKCNPGALNEFGAAAFRFGHSLIRPQMHRMDQFYNVKEPAVQLRESFNNPDKLYQLHMIDEIMRGLMSTPMETLDQFVTREVTNHLFEHKNRKYSGLDLISLNLQRGRDHGIRPYNDYRVICNLKRAQSFDELAREIPEEVIERLKQVYADVNDIDLFTGGLSERPLEGGMIGPTFGCIIGLQFRFLRKCDRFWYETADPVVRFTEAQLREIRKMSLAKVLCENCDVAESVQRRVFDMPHPFLNPRIPCQDLPTIDLRAWREPGPAPGTTCNIAGSIIQIGQSHLPSPCVQCTCTTEGSNCNSLRITNCEQLIATQPRDAVVNDRVCRAQCGHLLGDAINNNNLGPNNIRQARLVSNAVTPPAAPPAQNILPPQNPIINNNLGQQQVPPALAGGPLPPFDGSDGRRAPRRPGGNDFRPFRNRLNPLAALFRG